MFPDCPPLSDALRRSLTLSDARHLKQTDKDTERHSALRGARRLSRPSVYSLHTRAVSPLLTKDAAGTPDVPAPVLHGGVSLINPGAGPAPVPLPEAFGW
eukprot:s1801_g14.t1